MLTILLIPLLAFVAICFISQCRSSIPGPLLARFTNLWYLWQMKKGDFHATNIKLHNENGPIVRIAPNYYSISDPAVLKTIYGHGTKFEKSTWYDAWSFSPDIHQTNLFSERKSKKHAENRRKVASMYSMTSLVAYEPFVDNCVRIFKQRLEEFASKGTKVDMAYWLQCYAFDVIGEITFGDRFGFLDKGEDIGNIIEFLDSGLAVGSYLGLFVWLAPLFMAISRALGWDQSYANKFTWKHIQIAKATEKSCSADLPAHMAIKLVQAQSQNPLITDWDILSAAGANVGAGSDTTAISLSSVLFHMYRTPGCLDKVRKEIEESGMSEHPTFKDAQALPYLQAVMKEALRVHPGTGFPLFRIVPKGGVTMCGQYFPEGTNVGVNSWVVHFNTDIYGPDAAIFRPERWLEADKEQLKTMEQNFIPFGLGSRTCIGKNISLLEMSKLIPVFVREFDLDFADEIRDGLKVRNRWFVKPTNFEVSVKQR